jgi:enoyl-CoA hydratase/carnithine racemase
MEQPVLTEVRDGVGVITLNRPDKFNCISPGVATGLHDAVAGFEADRAVRCVLLRGAGKHFCTGADLDEIGRARRDKEALRAFIEQGVRTLTRLERSPLPVIGAVHGYCLAGGIEIMMACDVIFAAASARIGDQHARYGLIPGWGGTQRLPRLVGLRRALDLMFSARWLTAEEAQAWGLANYVTADDKLFDEAFAYAARLAKKSPDGLAAMKRLARQGLDRTLGDGLRLEVEDVVDSLRGANVDEGLAAFQARREPEFR